MHNFVTVMECLNVPRASCLVMGPTMLLYAVAAAAIGLGFIWARRDVEKARHRARWTFAWGAIGMAAAVAGIFLFAVFNPVAFIGAEESLLLTAMWIAVVALFGAGLYVVVAGLGLKVGSVLSRQFGGVGPSASEKSAPAKKDTSQ